MHPERWVEPTVDEHVSRRVDDEHEVTQRYCNVHPEWKQRPTRLCTLQSALYGQCFVQVERHSETVAEEEETDKAKKDQGQIVLLDSNLPCISDTQHMAN